MASFGPPDDQKL